MRPPVNREHMTLQFLFLSAGEIVIYIQHAITDRLTTYNTWMCAFTVCMSGITYLIFTNLVKQFRFELGSIMVHYTNSCRYLTLTELVKQS